MSGRVIVLGAGMVGVCCALSLQARGNAVTLIDRKSAGRETSFGNSGVLSRSSVFPINGPGIWRNLPAYAMNRHPAVRWRGSLLREPRWIIGFLAEATAESVARRSRALDALIRVSMDINRERITAMQLTRHVRETGWLKVWRSPPRGIAETEANALDGFGIKTRVLAPEAIAEIEPDATPVFRAGLHILDSASVDDPGALVEGFALAFARAGGTMLQAEARAVLATTAGWRIQGVANGQRIDRDADAVVVALGPWSADILAPLGLRLPLGFERGYHVHLAMPEGHGPRRAIYDVDGAYVVSPMVDGARVTSGVELAGRDATPNHAQIDRAEELARRSQREGKSPPPLRCGRRPSRGAQPPR